MWKKNQSVNHTKEGKYYSAALLTTSGVLFSALSGNIPLSIAVVILGLFFYFLTLFDGLYNLLRKRYAKKNNWKLIKGQYDFFYTGSDDKDDAITDNFLQRLTATGHVLFKIGGIAIFTTLYILIYLKHGT